MTKQQVAIGYYRNPGSLKHRVERSTYGRYGCPGSRTRDDERELRFIYREAGLPDHCSDWSARV